MHATQFDGEGERDELGLLFSEKWLRDGNGEWCYGKISFVFKKKSRQPQKYRILYHEGTTMESLEKDIQMAPETDDKTDSDDTRDEEGMTVDDREDEDDDDRHPYEQDETMAEAMMGEEIDGANVELDSDEDEDKGEDDTVTVGGYYTRSEKKERRNSKEKGQ